MMKILFTFFLAAIVATTFAQVCDDKNIRTDPLSSYTAPGIISPNNPEKQAAANRFNWRLDWSSIYVYSH